MNFIYELYKNDNFTLYLTIALVVLVILFVIVLLFGKKDQKLEETKKLEFEAFKEKKEEPTKVEVKEESLPSVVEENRDVAVIEKDKKEEEEEVNVETFTPDIIKEEVTPLVEDKEDLQIKEVENMTKKADEALEKDLKELEDIKNEFNKIAIPDGEKKEEIKPFKASQVFSSVYVSNKEKKALSNENISKVKEEEKAIPFIMADEEEMELPSLKSDTKKEEVVEVPKQEENNEEIKPLFTEETNDSPLSFNDISGESYNIK